MRSAFGFAALPCVTAMGKQDLRSHVLRKTQVGEASLVSTAVEDGVRRDGRKGFTDAVVGPTGLIENSVLQHEVRPRAEVGIFGTRVCSLDLWFAAVSS